MVVAILVSKVGRMDAITLVVVLSVTYLGGYISAYMNDDDIECKEIQYQPSQDNLGVHPVKDSYDSTNQVYIVKEKDYIDLNKYVKGMREDLRQCGDVVFTYNNDKFVIKEKGWW